MMQFLPWILTILVLFKTEVFNFFMSLSFTQWILLLGASSLCLFLFQEKIEHSIVLSTRKLKYFNIKKYIGKLSSWIEENNVEAIGKSLVSQLERNTLIRLGFIVLFIVIFGQYPNSLTSPISATMFLLTLIACCLASLAFKRGMLIAACGLYLLMAVTPFGMAFLSYRTGINFFETLPVDLLNLLNINTFDLTQTANKLFLFTAPWFALAILCLILTSVIIHGSLKLTRAVFLKILQSLNSA